MVFYFVARETTLGPAKTCKRHAIKFLGAYADDPHFSYHAMGTKVIRQGHGSPFPDGRMLWWGTVDSSGALPGGASSDPTATVIALATGTPMSFERDPKVPDDSSRGIVLGGDPPVPIGHWKTFSGEQVIRTYQDQFVLDLILIRSDCEPKTRDPLLLPKCLVRRLMKSIHPYEGVTLINVHGMDTLHLDLASPFASGIQEKLCDTTKDAWVLSKDEAECIESGMEQLCGGVQVPIGWLMMHSTADRILVSNDQEEIAELICVDAIFKDDCLPPIAEMSALSIKGKERAT